MSKEPKTTAAATDANADPVVLVSVDEFCARLSATIRRPELINGFAHSERAAGRANDTESGFRARYSAFINQPV